MKKISERVRNRISRDFGVARVEEVAEMLSEIEDPMLAKDEQHERVELAILHLAQGDSDGLLTQVMAAQSDWRDVLVAAGLADTDWREVLRLREGSTG